MKRKAIATLLAGVMTVSMLAGCGDAAPTEAPAPVQEETTENEAPAEEASAEVSEDGYFTDEKGNKFFTDTDGTVYYVDSEGTKYKKFDDVTLNAFVLYQNADPLVSLEDQKDNPIANAIRDKLGVTVLFEWTEILPAEKLNMMIATGDMPQMLMSYYGGGSDDRVMAVRKAIDEEMLYDITDLVPQYENIKDAWNPPGINQGWIDSELDRAENNGRRYVIPHNTPASAQEQWWGSACVCVRADVAETLGVDPSTIKTSDELFDFMMAAKEYGFKDINGNDCIVAGAMENGWAYENYFQNELPKKVSEFSLDEDGNITYDCLTDSFINRYMYMWKLNHNGLFDVECLTQNEETANQKVGNGTYIFASTNYDSALNRQKLSGLYTEHPEMRYIPVGPLNWAGGEPGTYIAMQGEAEPACTMFGAQCTEEEVEAGLTFLNYLSGKEGAAMYEYGIEGETYELNENGQPRMLQKWADMCLERGSNETDKMLKEQYGLGYMHRVGIMNHKKEWFGEGGRWDSLFSDEVTEYLKTRPLEALPGISANSFASQYSNYADMAVNCLDVVKKRDYIFRAVFAPTEEEARQYLVEYQEFLKNYNNGEIYDMFDEMKELMEGKEVAW